jgi:hypothetical protein
MGRCAGANTSIKINKGKQLSKYCVFQVTGGIGKHIAATAVAKAIKNNHPERKLIVVCAWPEVFLGLPCVDRVYRLGVTPHFYTDYVEDKESLFFLNDPYYTTDHINKKKQLIRTWCDSFGLKFSGETPELAYNQLQQELCSGMWVREKPVMVIHTNGGPMMTNSKPYSWTRDMPLGIAMALVDHYKKDFHIIQVTKVNSPKIEGVEHLFSTQEKSIGSMELFTLMLYSQKRVLIDSCLQHASAAFNKKSTVLWNGTSPKVFGYDVHDNICTKIPKGVKLPDSYLFDFSFEGRDVEYPFEKNAVLFDVNEIIESVNQQ